MVKVHILLSNLTHILTKRFRGFYYNRSYFSHASHDDKELSFDEARSWFLKFKSSSIPEKIAKTTFSRSSGPGGQKTNKFVLILTNFQTNLTHNLGLAQRQQQCGLSILYFNIFLRLYIQILGRVDTLYYLPSQFPSNVILTEANLRIKQRHTRDFFKK